jgi:hypothetical protein
MIPSYLPKNLSEYHPLGIYVVINFEFTPSSIKKNASHYSHLILSITSFNFIGYATFLTLQNSVRSNIFVKQNYKCKQKLSKTKCSCYPVQAKTTPCPAHNYHDYWRLQACQMHKHQISAQHNRSICHTRRAYILA